MSIPPKFPGAVPYDSAAAYLEAYADEMAQAWKTLDSQSSTALPPSCTEGTCGARGLLVRQWRVRVDREPLGLRPHERDPGQDRLAAQGGKPQQQRRIAHRDRQRFGYEDVFTYQLQSHAVPGDVLVAISSSGRFAEYPAGADLGQDNGLHTIAITGFEGGAARTLADVAIHFECTNYGIVEDLHQAVMHALAQYIRQSRMTADTISATVF